MSVCLSVCLVLHVYVGVEPLIQTPMGQKKCPYCNTYKSSTCIWGGKGVLFRSCLAAYSCCVRSKSDDVIPVLAHTWKDSMSV